MQQNRVRTSIPTATWGYLLILGVIVFGAILREINLLIILSGLMVGPLMINWQLVRSTLRRLSVRRSVPSAVFPGKRFRVELELSNNRPALDSWTLRLQDSISRISSRVVLPHGTAACFLPHVPASQSRKVAYEMELPQRGRYRLGPLRISTQMPAGLLEGRILYEQSTDILVWPRLGILQAGLRQLARFDQTGNQSSRRQQGLSEGDFFGLREWRTGDSRRWIHWRSSAKRDSLVVRQFEQHRHEDLIVILDLGRWQPPATNASHTSNASSAATPAAPNGPPRVTPNIDLIDAAHALEYAVSFVATLLADHCQGASGGLTVTIAGADPRCVRGAASAPMLQELLNLLAEAAPTADDPLPAQMGETLLGTSPHDRILWVSPQPIVPQADRFAAWTSAGQPTAILVDAIRVDSSDTAFWQLFDWDSPQPQSNPVRTAPVREVVR